jgi:hypothetical protein
MGRRSGEIQFGSDSFLDVVCNLVGILIILIVMAGVRVSRAPVMVFPRTSPTAVAADNGAGEADAPSPFQVAATGLIPTDPPLDPLFVEEELPDDTADITRQIAELDDERQMCRQRVIETEGQLTAAHEQQSTMAERLAAARTMLAKTEGDLASAQQYAAATTAELSTLRDRAAQLAEQVRTAQLQTPAAQRIKHTITPVGKTVTGDELHFRIEHDRVSVVPLDALLKRLKDQIERRKDWLAKARQHEGEVGPVAGFTLRYLVQRENPSVVDELRYGAGMYRISVSEWELELDRGVVSESVDQALQPGSKFYQTLLEAKSDSALTFWVYPDSFEAYGLLKSFCYEQNFLVAGRPLPAGVPIAGSPRGTRSTGQ